VRQDAATGPDGRAKGARPLIATAKGWKGTGIVTYPGGDRVDWRVVTLPKAPGTLTLSIEWDTPRPGLRAYVDVFDGYMRPIERIRIRSSPKRVRKIIEGMHGLIYVRVAAARRQDAGHYRLRLAYKKTAPIVDDFFAVEIPDPPKLPRVPDYEPCDPFTFDASNRPCPPPPCRPGSPPGWPGCPERCPNPPDIQIPACWNTMPCPSPPDPRVKACAKAMVCPTTPDPNNPQDGCPKRATVNGRVVRTEISGNRTVATIARGSDHGVTRSWVGTFVRDETSEVPVAGGEVRIIRVDKKTTIVTTQLSVDAVAKTPWVQLRPP
jgi:hypothetical protein